MTQQQKHSVIEKLLLRKGKSGPFVDGRKIGLVLPGGLMSGVNGAGAMCALQALGLAQSFDVIFSASAGFPNASYLLAEDTERGSTIYYEEFSGKRFIHFWKFWNPIDFDWAVKSVRSIKPLDYKKIWESKTDLILRVSDYSDTFKKRVYLRMHDYSPDEYFDFLRASISSPVFSRCAKIHLRKLCDGHITNKDVIEQINYALASDCTDLLIIYNQKSQKEIAKLVPNERFLEITPSGDSNISVFETRSDVLKKAHADMKQKTFALFN